VLVYLVLNRVNGKKYIGQTIHPFPFRWQQHQYQASKGSRNLIHQAIRKYGIDQFDTSILAEVQTIEELNALEARYIKEHNALVPNGYNLTTGGLNYQRSAETKKKMSLAQIGNKKSVGPVSEKHRRNLSISATGRVLSEETRKKISEAKKRYAATPEGKLMMSKIAKHKLSPEHRANISAAQTGKKRPRKAKVSELERAA
jgi:group I intron endonuclease